MGQTLNMTKSEAARIIAEGRGVESFHHDTLGNFNVTALREMVNTGAEDVHYCPFDAIQMVDGIEGDALEYLIGHREIDRERVASLTPAQLEDPLLFLECPAGSNGEQASQLLVDGIHRLVALKERNYDGFYFYLVPLEDAPRIDTESCEEIPWGEMDLIPGQGLVKRKQTP